MIRRALPLLAVAAVLLVPATSWSHPARVASSLTGTIEVVPGGIKVTVTNNGSDAFNYFLIKMVPSVHHTSATIDRGGGCGAGPDSNTVRCGISFAGFKPGETYTVTIMTDAAYPANGGAQLFAGVGTSGTSFTPAGNATGPAAPPPTPCLCESFDELGASPSNFTDSHTFVFDIDYKLECTGGAGTCRGQITVAKQGINDLTIATPKKQPVACTGRCGNAIGGRSIRVIGHSKNDLGLKARRGKTFRFRITGYCLDAGGKAQLRSAATVRAVYDARGFVDRKKSDLNADGHADGAAK